MPDNPPTTLDVWTPSDTRSFYTVYCATGQQPASAEDLEAEGLIKREFDAKGVWKSTLVYDQDNARVLAWQLTMNAQARFLGIKEPFLNLPFFVIPDAPQGNA